MPPLLNVTLANQRPELLAELLKNGPPTRNTDSSNRKERKNTQDSLSSPSFLLSYSLNSSLASLHHQPIPTIAKPEIVITSPESVNNVNRVPTLHIKRSSSRGDDEDDGHSLTHSPRRHTIHVDDTSRLSPCSSLAKSSYPVPKLSSTSLQLVNNLTEKHIPKGVTSSKHDIRRTSKKFLLKCVEMERKKRKIEERYFSQLDDDHVEEKRNLVDLKAKENILLTKSAKEIEEKLDSVTQKLTFLEKQSHRDKELIKFYRNRERVNSNLSTTPKINNPLLQTASNFMAARAQPVTSIQQAVISMFDGKSSSDPFEIRNLANPPKGTNFESIVYYWKVFCKISYVCRFVLGRDSEQ